MNEYWIKVGQGALGGLVVALKIDWDAFRDWKGYEDFRAYDWGKASFRWIQGVVIGAGIAAGFDAGLPVIKSALQALATIFRQR